MDWKLAYVRALARRHCEQIGFIPQARYEQELARGERGRLWLALENAEPCGFLLWGGVGETVRIHQACIQYDAQRREHGRALVRRLIDESTARGRGEITARVALDIEANQFWQALGFKAVAEVAGGKRRGRRIVVYRLRLRRPVQRTLFEPQVLGGN